MKQETELPPPAGWEWLAEIEGTDYFFNFLQSCGGQRIYIPAENSKKFFEKTKLCQTWGEKFARAIQKRYGGSDWSVPILKDWQAKYLAARGLSRNEIAARLGVTRRTAFALVHSSKSRIEKIRQNKTALIQQDLFF